MDHTPAFVAPTRHTDALSAVRQIQAIYQAGVMHLRQCMHDYVAGRLQTTQRARAFYPFVRLHTDRFFHPDPASGTSLSYGFVAGTGQFETTLTQPDLFEGYYLEQLTLLLHNHGGELEVGTSHQPIALHFSLAENDYVEGYLTPDRQTRMREVFDYPDLAAMDDGIANGTFQAPAGGPEPLALFTAPRVDYSLQRLRHYCGTSPQWFQHFVLFTNYQFYIDEFVKIGLAAMQQTGGEYVAFVEPGNVVTHAQGFEPPATWVQGQAPVRMPQMPAYHLVRADGSGITMINIGVGPSNAKTMSDHVAVLRPYAWLMLGHCAGLRTSQKLGDYVLAHAYVREDHVLDEELPTWVPIPALAEVQMALETAVSDVTGVPHDELKSIMRTGTVASTDNRNWELLPMAHVSTTPQKRLSQSRAVALDMESAAIAANGFRFRVPYGTLLCVSDKPLHGEIKLPGMANHFYRERVDQHLRIGIRTVELLRQHPSGQLQSRKLRSFAEVAFR